MCQINCNWSYCWQYEGLPGSSNNSGVGTTYYAQDVTLSPSGSLTVDTWNAFSVPSSLIEACGLATCSKLLNNGTVAEQSAFFDPGTNLQVYGWTPDAATGIVQASPSGYTATYANATSGAVTGTLTATASLIVPFFDPTGTLDVYTATMPPVGTIWTATVVTADGKTYTTSPVTQNSGSYGMSLSTVTLATSRAAAGPANRMLNPDSRRRSRRRLFPFPGERGDGETSSSLPY
jgi:hypothetical protein